MPRTATSDFVPPDLDCSDFANIKPYYEKLLARDIDSNEDLEQWLIDYGELEATVGEAHTQRYIAMTCQTDDLEKAREYREFEEQVVPQIKPLAFALNQKFVNCDERGKLDPQRYTVLDRDLANEVELFREENVPLETKLAGLSQDYDTICGAMTVTVDGEELTLPQAGKLLEETDRDLRERVWRALAERRLQDADKIRDIYDEMRPIRQQIAENAGFENFRDFAFRALRRFDYTPAMCEEFHRGVEAHVVPVRKRLLEERAETMGLESVRPWDVAVDPQGRAPLRPFETADQLVENAHAVFASLDESLSELFAELRDGTSLDLESRKGKAPGGYQATRYRQRKPFIFMNAAGTARDVETMLHEAGHAFHTMLSRHDPLNHYRNAYGAEIAEVASMSMELLTYDFMDSFYSEEENLRYRRKHLEGIVQVLCWIAQIDAFQHWIYTHPKHTPAERDKVWLELDERFGAGVDWSGLEQYRREYWQRQLHLFGVPFYYIEYGIAQLGALQLWLQFKEEPRTALTNYRNALSLGASKPLPDLFGAAELPFDFGPDVIARCMKTVEEELEGLPA
jgi:oligoendopeptidase F